MPKGYPFATEEERIVARAATHHRYRESVTGRLRNRTFDLDRKRPPGPAGSPGPFGAAAQRERRRRPEYVLAQRLGIRVAMAREMMSSYEH